jgi:PqqD family protein of HPr-rel-A system
VGRFPAFSHATLGNRAAESFGHSSRQQKFVRIAIHLTHLVTGETMDLNKLKNLALSETGFLFDPSTGNTFTVNETAAFILNSMKSGLKRDAIAGALADEFDVSEQMAREDVSDTLLQLGEAGIIAAGSSW